MTTTVFSEFELRAMSVKFDEEAEYEKCDCVGSSEEGMNTRVVSKKCRGVVNKKVAKGDGTGSLKISAHIPYGQYVKAYGMDLDTLKDGVYAYGRNSVHKKMSIVQDVYDEDGNEKLKAYPNCIIESGIARKIENGAEEVAELELEISIMPDEHGNGMYEAIVTDTLDKSVASTWMTAFTPDLVAKTTQETTMQEATTQEAVQ